MTGVEIDFPNLGIELHHIRSGIEIFGFKIAFYGMIIAFGMIMGFLLVSRLAKKSGQNPEVYLDFALYAIVFSVIGARIYYVIFSWNDYKDNLIEVFNIRGGGMAIYGSVIAGSITAVIYSKIRKLDLKVLLDTSCIGLIVGQIIGRWGNFFNCEAFGGYAGNSLFAMRLPWDTAVSHMSAASADAMRQYVVDGAILVHPTFLYESMWNVGVLLLLLFVFKHKKYDGQVVLCYVAGYGLGRLWIEGLRTDQLLLWGTSIPVSQVLALILFLGAAGTLLYQQIKIKNKK